MALFKKTKYSTVRATPKKNIPAGLWLKCKGCGTVIYRSNLDENLQVCLQCNYHYRLTASQRIEMLVDPSSFCEMDVNLQSLDCLGFGGKGEYASKLEQTRKKTGMSDAIVCGTASLEKRQMALGVMDFRFFGASMGSVVGEKIARLVEAATQKHLPLVMVTASGGARMQEGVLSLMQMAKTSGAIALHNSEGLPYIVIMTNPTTGGVTASFASLGDVILAEPGALVAFAGPRVIKQTTQSELPPGFQTAEFLMEHGFIDRVVSRHDLRNELSLLLEYFSGASRCAEGASAV